MRALVLLALLAGPAGAEGWGAFYGTPAAPAPALGPESVCVSEIKAAQRRHAIPGNLLLAIGIQEAGRRRAGKLTIWPYAVNASGESRMFESAAEARDFVRLRRSEGMRSIDVGCMQVNLRWHPEAFASLAEGFDPKVNVEYAARLLLDLKDELGSWEDASGAYHSRTPQYQEAYLGRLEGNIRLANTHDFGPAPAPAKPPRGRIGWGAGLSGNGGGTPYSAARLRAVR